MARRRTEVNSKFRFHGKHGQTWTVNAEDRPEAYERMGFEHPDVRLDEISGCEEVL
ncbi:MAG: hypothetical protein LYZ70_04215 [Nitrososphaerales archaeon]|nr:hypothetical protein [Nitrososphaerales archaeon]